MADAEASRKGAAGAGGGAGGSLFGLLLSGLVEAQREYLVELQNLAATRSALDPTAASHVAAQLERNEALWARYWDPRKYGAAAFNLSPAAAGAAAADVGAQHTTEDPPRAIAWSLYKAMKGFGTDEAAIYTNLGRIRSPPHWRDVVDAFRTQHPDFHRGRLITAMKDELNNNEFTAAKAVLRDNGIEMYGGDAPDAGASVATDAGGMADALYKAMKGFGTDEDAIYAVLSRVKDQDHWTDVRGAFARDYDEFHKGDLLDAIDDEMTKKELAKCEAILRGNGVEMRALLVARQASDASAAAGGGGADADADPPGSIANTLHKAMKGFGTDEDAIYGALGLVRSPSHWAAVQDAFRTQHDNFHKGQLVAALRDELNDKEFARATEVLAAHGVAMYAADGVVGREDTTAPPPAAPGTDAALADSLHASLTARPARGEETVEFLGSLTDAAAAKRVADAYRDRYPGTCGGDMNKSLRALLSPQDLARCEAALNKLGASLGEDVVPFRECDARAQAISDALRRDPVDADAVVATLEAVPTLQACEDLVESFRAMSPELHEGDIALALRNMLLPDDLERCEAIVNKLGGSLGGDPPNPVAEAIGNALLLPDLKERTDAVIALLDTLPDLEACQEVVDSFYRHFPHINGGMLPAALAERLPPAGLAMCEVLANRRQALLDVDNAPLAHACRLHIALTECPVDEGLVTQRLLPAACALTNTSTTDVTDTPDGKQLFTAVVAAFRTCYPDYHGGVLADALDATISAESRAICREIVLSVGGELELSVPDDVARAPTAAGPPSAGAPSA